MEKKMNNKGFSLVELIIVIAIMAILVGIVGSQVVPYLEKSRKSKDIQILSAWCTDAMSSYSSNAATLEADKVYEITITDTAVTATGGDNTDKLVAGFCELNGLTASGGSAGANFKWESKAGKAITKVTIQCCDPSSKAATDAGLKNIITVQVTTSDSTKYSFDSITSN